MPCHSKSAATPNRQKASIGTFNSRAPCQFQSHMGALFALFRTAKHRAKPNIPRIRNRRAIFYLRYTRAVFAFVAKSDAGYGNRRSWCENIACGAKHIAYMNKYKHNIQIMRLGTLFLIQQLPVCCRKVEKQKWTWCEEIKFADKYSSRGSKGRSYLPWTIVPFEFRKVFSKRRSYYGLLH